MKRLYIVIAAIFVFFACSKNGIIDNPLSGKSRRMILSVSMPGTLTRIALSREGKDVRQIWEDGDKIQLCLVQGNKKLKQVVAVKNISSDRKKADFDIVLPEGWTGSFDLYGVYGGRGLEDSNPSIALLPGSPWSNSGNLTEIQKNKHVMLYFSKKDVGTVKDIDVQFEHMGSLFCVKLKNTTDADWDREIKDVAIYSAGGSSGWALNSSNSGESKYDLITGEFISSVSSNHLPMINKTAVKLGAGETVEFWGWFPPAKGVCWPEILLKVDQGRLSTSNTKPARTSPALSGKSYYFYAAWNGSELRFTDKDFKPVEKMSFKTSKEKGECIELYMDAFPGDRDNIWIDLNNNGKKDTGEEVSHFGSHEVYVIESQDVTIYGVVSELSCEANGICKMDVSKNTALKRLVCSKNDLTELNVSNMPYLSDLDCKENSLVSLNATNNPGLLNLDCSDNENLSELDISGNKNLTTLDCSKCGFRLEMLRKIIEALPQRKETDITELCIYDNPGYKEIDENDINKAGKKNWTIYEEGD